MLTQTVLPTPTILPPTHGTLEDLRQLQRDWLEEARQAGHLTACRIIAWTLGEKEEHRYRPEIDARVWRSGSLKIECWQWSSHWQPHRRDYTRNVVILVDYGDLKVCRHHETTGTTKNDNYFIPGPWTDELAAPLAEAQQAIADQEAAALAEEHQRLLSKLLGL